MSDVLDEDSAEVAFAALGLKVDGLSVQLARLEKLSKRASVDYAPTLATISADLAKMELAVRALYGAPALKMPVEEFQATLENARARAGAEVQRELQETRNELHAAAREVRSSLEAARTKRKQDWRLVQVGATCWVGGTILWAGLAGPLARATPAAWALPEKMAAATLGADRWMAGQRMMASAKPADWRGVKQGAALVQNNQAALTACAIQAEQAVTPVRCSLKVLPGGDADGELGSNLAAKP